MRLPPEMALSIQMQATELPPFESEYRFKPPRRWRFDFAWPIEHVAVEVEGLTRQGGRHQRFDGYTKDCDKYNAALLDGWCVLRFTQRHINQHAAVPIILQALERRWILDVP